MSGFSLSVGYGIGIRLVLFWHYLELPQSGSKFQRIAKRVTTIAVVSNVAYFMWHATVWQNSIRLLMEMDPLESAYSWPVAIIAVLVGIMWLAFFRAIRKGYFYIDNKLSKILPRRVSLVLSLVVICSLLFFIINGILAKQDLNLADSIFLRLDRITDEGIQQPTHALASGSDESLIAWGSIGRQGKEFIVHGPTQEQLEEFTDANPLRPLRVYVVLNSRTITPERSKLALEELSRGDPCDLCIFCMPATP